MAEKNASPLLPKSGLSHPTSGLCVIDDTVLSVAAGMNFWIPNDMNIRTMLHRKTAAGGYRFPATLNRAEDIGGRLGVSDRK